VHEEALTCALRRNCDKVFDRFALRRVEYEKTLMRATRRKNKRA
jgi:hypothetical protein